MICPLCGREATRLITLRAEENGRVWGVSICPDSLQLKGRVLYETPREKRNTAKRGERQKGGFWKR